MYQQMYPHLFSPLRIKKITFRNRIFSTPNTSLLICKVRLCILKKPLVELPSCTCRNCHYRKIFTARTWSNLVLDDITQLGLLGEFALAVSHGAVPSYSLIIMVNKCGRKGITAEALSVPMGYIREDGVEVIAMDEDMIESY